MVVYQGQDLAYIPYYIICVIFTSYTQDLECGKIDISIDKVLYGGGFKLSFRVKRSALR